MNTLISLIFLFFLHRLSLSIHATPYTAADRIFINCGTSGISKSEDRDWLGDQQPSKYAPTENNHTASRPVNALPGPFKVPYLTARVSLSNFAYAFPLSPGPKFVRLHFNPTSYQGLNRSSALFSVTVGGFIFLNNFTGSMLSDSLDQKPLDEPFYREFCINVDNNQKLEIQFSPSKSVAGSYAFINGMEVVSMPTYLYYSPPQEQDKVPRFIGIGPTDLFRITTSSSLETVHRLNVGGGAIKPAEDTGMYRTWFGDDKTYIVGPSQGALPLNLSVTIKYTKSTPDYVAPDKVYRTGRSMGMSAEENVKYNLTWKLPVDMGFKYLIRLHFCEFESEVTERSDREFTIFINNLTADAYFDVISWSGGNGIPVYKDYVVMMESEWSEKERDYVLVALHPNDRSRTRHQDAILNGLEMFKISDGTDLAGASSENIVVLDSPKPPDSFTPLGKKQPVFAPAIGAGLGGGMAVIMVIVVCMVCYMRRKSGKMHGAARGLEYLHGGATHMIIHRDVKSTNILLDSKWAARVADFGLSKFGPTMDQDNQISTIVKGTRGYLDPEYIKLGRLTTKCDVYSFGVVLLEVISGRRPVDHGLDDDRVSLARWAQDCKKRGALHQLIDPYLVDQIAQECLRNFVDLAISCLRENGIRRPTMKDVVGKLEFVLQLQVEADAALQSIVLSGGPPSVVVSTGITPADSGHLADSLGSGFTTVFGTKSPNALTCRSIDSESTTSSDDDREGGP
ncbi:Protein kinase domain [Dillenia turbinata]|uniref:Protein kinase domain n=1 Tax=Dillenia turbinata TaxID=194707 RepID=A0AAN8ULG5_9MAGN